MLLLIVLSVLVVVQFGGVANGLQHDTWYKKFGYWLAQQAYLSQYPELWVLIAVLVPTTVIVLLEHVLFNYSLLLYYLLSVVVLLYCLGRGEFSVLVDNYFRAYNENDWQRGVRAAQALDVSQRAAEVAEGDWCALSILVFKRACYRGFERLFAVFFWYVVLGLAGALLYRLGVLAMSFRYQESQRPGADEAAILQQMHTAQRFVGLMEWPAVRLLGLSFALTGNFVSCFSHWRDCFWNAECNTTEVMYRYVQGALSITPEEAAACDPVISQQEADLLQQLVSRTLIFWLSVLAVVYLFL